MKSAKNLNFQENILDNKEGRNCFFFYLTRFVVQAYIRPLYAFLLPKFSSILQYLSIFSLKRWGGQINFDESDKFILYTEYIYSKERLEFEFHIFSFLQKKTLTLLFISRTWIFAPSYWKFTEFFTLLISQFQSLIYIKKQVWVYAFISSYKKETLEKLSLTSSYPDG